MQKFLINVKNLKIFTTLIICLLNIHSVLAECSDDEWDCDNGSCIELEKLCDGYIDCSDKSDEIAENCIQNYRNCPKFGFACTYGACIPAARRCDNVQNCADNSDESMCSDSWMIELQGACGADKLQCLKSKECIELEKSCDGERDCSDGSDETVEVCAQFECYKQGFHCGYGGCVDGDAICNGTIECRDGSDEAWQLCGTPRKTIEKPIGPISATGGEPPTGKPTPPQSTPSPRPKRTVGTRPATSLEGVKCQIPHDVEDVTIRLHPLNTTILPGSLVEDSETIHVECSNPADASRSVDLFCDNGNFNSKFPTCSNYCDGRLLQGISTIYHCYDKEGYLIEPCHWKIAPNTVIDVICALGYKRSRGHKSQKITCLSSGVFDFEREKCEPRCGFVQPSFVPLTRKGFNKVHPNNVPWHVGIYEFYDNEYSFICGGSIISPRLILSAAHCFWDKQKRTMRPAGSYQFMAGKYTRKYQYTGDEMPQIREAASIEISEEFHSNKADVALVKLKEPFKFNENISSVCIVLKAGGGSDYVESGIIGNVTGYGQNNTLKQVSMKTISYQTCKLESHAEHLTDDTFCLQNDNDMSICRGDSGGGFTVQRMVGNVNIHEIMGIIKYTPLSQLDCANNALVSATNVRFIEPDLAAIIRNEMINDSSIF